MGAANRRGTREQRVAAAIVRDNKLAALRAIYQKRLEESDEYKARQRIASAHLALTAGLVGAFNPHVY